MTRASTISEDKKSRITNQKESGGHKIDRTSLFLCAASSMERPRVGGVAREAGGQVQRMEEALLRAAVQPPILLHKRGQGTTQSSHVSAVPEHDAKMMSARQ
jgi:hypothetical protein